MTAARRTEDTRHLLPRYVDRAAMRHEQARVAAEAILETGCRLPSADSQLHDFERDPRVEYRNVPIMGATRVSAAIPGTDPLSALLASEARYARR